MNAITVGRSPENTISVSPNYATVSGHHVTITQANGQLYLQDHSTNGTYINGQFVHNNQQIAITPNDTITLGREYHLDMSAVVRALQATAGGGQETRLRQPQAQGQAVVVNIQNNVYKPHTARPQEQQPIETPHRTEPKNLNSFNWGAFWFSWLWAVCHNVWWGLLCFIPFVNMVVPFVLGFKGNRAAWEKFSGTAEEFERKQAAWSKWGWIIFVVTLVLYIIITIANI